MDDGRLITVSCVMNSVRWVTTQNIPSESANAPGGPLICAAVCECGGNYTVRGASATAGNASSLRVGCRELAVDWRRWESESVGAEANGANSGSY